MATPLFVQDVDRLAVPRLSEVLFDRTVRRFGSIAELPSNIEAIDAGLTFANGHSPFVSIVGPSGWGKTHLLECVANHISREFKVHVGILSAIDWLDGRGAYNPRNPLLLDNVQDAISRTRTRVQLRLALERRVRIGRPTMLALTGDRLTRQHASFLPNCREWSVQEIGEPTPLERGVVVKRMAESERLLLSKPLLDLISTRMMGNGYTIHGALNRLKMLGPEWTTPADFLRATGVLDPFFADNSSWDLMERIRKAVDATVHQHPGIDGNALCCHAMIRIAQLSELEVARFCGVPPARARTLAIGFERRLRDSEGNKTALDSFLDLASEAISES
jgi:hypothetical protein